MKYLKEKAFWEAAAHRAVRTFCQVLAAGYVSGMALEEVQWKSVLSVAAASSIFSIVMAVGFGLPEAEE